MSTQNTIYCDQCQTPTTKEQAITVSMYRWGYSQDFCSLLCANKFMTDPESIERVSVVKDAKKT